MNRKLHNSLLAFSVTGLLLAMGLLAARPALSPFAAIDEVAARAQPVATLATAPAVVVWSTADDALGRAAWADAIASDAGDQARIVEDGLRSDAYAHLDGLIAGALTVTREVSANAALAKALQASGADAALALRNAERNARRRHDHRLRSALAVPYFSFAQGLRSGAGS